MKELIQQLTDALSVAKSYLVTHPPLSAWDLFKEQTVLGRVNDALEAAKKSEGLSFFESKFDARWSMAYRQKIEKLKSQLLDLQKAFDEQTDKLNAATAQQNELLDKCNELKLAYASACGQRDGALRAVRYPFEGLHTGRWSSAIRDEVSASERVGYQCIERNLRLEIGRLKEELTESNRKLDIVSQHRDALMNYAPPFTSSGQVEIDQLLHVFDKSMLSTERCAAIRALPSFKSEAGRKLRSWLCVLYHRIQKFRAERDFFGKQATRATQEMDAAVAKQGALQRDNVRLSNECNHWKERVCFWESYAKNLEKKIQ